MKDLFSEFYRYLKNSTFSFNAAEISLLDIAKSLLLVTVFFTTASFLSRRIEKKIAAGRHFQPSTKVLITKAIRILLSIFAVYLSLSLVGIDLSLFAFFAGAFGVAFAFGVQNICSNFFCGLILLFDKSIKPGDVISIEDGKVCGIVNKLHTRYVSIRTREGKEHLIPNEYFITHKFENWSFSDTNVRLEIPFTLSIQSDLERVQAILLAIAAEAPRILKEPKPAVHFTAMKENSINLSLHFWIADPHNGIGSIKSRVIFEAYKAFKEENIKSSFPPREIHYTAAALKGAGRS